MQYVATASTISLAEHVEPVASGGKRWQAAVSGGERWRAVASGGER